MKTLKAIQELEIAFTGGYAIAVMLILAYVMTVGTIQLLGGVAHLIKILIGR